MGRKNKVRQGVASNKKDRLWLLCENRIYVSREVSNEQIGKMSSGPFRENAMESSHIIDVKRANNTWYQELRGCILRSKETILVPKERFLREIILGL